MRKSAQRGRWVAVFRYILLRILWLLVSLAAVVALIYLICSMAMLTIWSPYTEFGDDIVTAFDNLRMYLLMIVTEWDWGVTRNGEPVWELVAYRMPRSLMLMALSLLFYILFGMVLGMIGALRQSKPSDLVIRAFTMTFSSLPGFVLIIPLILFFGFELDLLPRWYPHAGELHERALAYVIPVLAVSGPPLAQMTQSLRNELIDTMDADYMLMARTKGLNKRQAVFRHGFKNAIISVLPHIPGFFSFAVMNSFVVEQMYGMRGMASLLLSVMYRASFGGYFQIDIPITVALASFYVALAFVAAMLVDIVNSALDPSMRFGGKKTSLDV